MTKLVPLEDHVLIEVSETEQTTKSGIVVAQTTKEKPSKGKVIAVGAGKVLDNGQRSSMDVQEGDIVHFTPYAPDEITVGTFGEAKTYFIIKQSSILAKEVA